MLVNIKTDRHSAIRAKVFPRRLAGLRVDQVTQLVDGREVEVGPLHVLRHLHDVIATRVTSGAHHPVQHELEGARVRGVGQEESTWGCMRKSNQYNMTSFRWKQ